VWSVKEILERVFLSVIRRAERWAADRQSIGRRKSEPEKWRKYGSDAKFGEFSPALSQKHRRGECALLGLLRGANLGASFRDL